MTENTETKTNEAENPAVTANAAGERAAALTVSGTAVASCVGRLPAKSLVPVVCLYAPDAGYGKGCEVFHAPNEDSAKALMLALANAETQDRATLGTVCDIVTDPDGAVEVRDKSGKTGPSRFIIGVTYAAVSFPGDEATLPDSLKAMSLPAAEAQARPADTAGADKKTDDNALLAALLGNPALAAGLSGDSSLLALSESGLAKALTEKIGALSDEEKKAWAETAGCENPALPF